VIDFLTNTKGGLVMTRRAGDGTMLPKDNLDLEDVEVPENLKGGTDALLQRRAEEDFGKGITRNQLGENNPHR
jgi:hypothetical protein